VEGGRSPAKTGKIRIVLSGLRGEDSIAERCRREGIVQNLYYHWSGRAPVWRGGQATHPLEWPIKLIHIALILNGAAK